MQVVHGPEVPTRMGNRNIVPKMENLRIFQVNDLQSAALTLNLGVNLHSSQKFEKKLKTRLPKANKESFKLNGNLTSQEDEEDKSDGWYLKKTQHNSPKLN